MSEKRYRGKDIDVTFELKRCIHAAECGKRLSVVFDVNKRPWVQPDNASADLVQDTIEHCPSGALKFIRHDGGQQEQTPTENRITVKDSGEYVINGDVTLQYLDGEPVAEEYRMTLCRCGDSNNKPFCDNSHRKARFFAPSEVQDNSAETPHNPPNGKLTISITPKGPLLLKGNVAIQDQSGEQVYSTDNAALCRCGASANKPFCDGSHKEIGFSAE